VLRNTACIVRGTTIILFGGEIWETEFKPNTQTWVFNTKNKSWKNAPGNPAVKNIRKCVAVDLGNSQTLIYGGEDISKPNRVKPNYVSVFSKVVKEEGKSKSVTNRIPVTIENMLPHPFVLTKEHAILLTQETVHKFNRST
jgi:hypothetical protein